MGNGPGYRSVVEHGPMPWSRMLALLFAVGLAGSINVSARGDDCVAPERPPIPDGATATMDTMLAGQQAVKAFQDSNMAYMHCLERRFNAARERIDEAPDNDARADYARAVDAYTAAVSAEEEVAGAFNAELRAYRAAHR